MIATSRNLVLAGPMGSGKSAVGRLVASWTGRRLVDTDELVATAAGKSIPQLFAEDGEAAFRALEADAIQAVAERTHLVVALGGGAVVDPRNVVRLRATSHVVVLDATPAALARRVEGGQRAGTRPLLDGVEDVPARLAEVQAARAQAYADAAHVTLDTTDVPLEKVAALVVAWAEQQA